MLECSDSLNDGINTHKFYCIFDKANVYTGLFLNIKVVLLINDKS